MRTGVGRHVAVLAILLLPLALLSHPKAASPVEAALLPQETAGPQPGSPKVPDPSRRRSVTIALTGDVLIHNTVWAAAQRNAERRGESAKFDFRPMLDPIRSVIAGADLAICHLETPLAPLDGPYLNFPRFAAPQEIAPALRWAGYDACSTGSNHSLDQGFSGLARTLNVLDSVGLRHTGTSRTRAESQRAVVFDVDGIRLGWLEYTYGTNGIPVDADKPWSVNLIDPARILRDAHRLRKSGADAVAVGLHWGTEYQTTPSVYQLDLARRLSKSPDITFIYGHHAHVVEPISKVHGTWVIWGLGNLLADQGDTAPGVDQGLIALVTLTERRDGRMRVSAVAGIPTEIDAASGFRVRLAGPGQPAEAKPR